MEIQLAGLSLAKLSGCIPSRPCFSVEPKRNRNSRTSPQPHIFTQFLIIPCKSGVADIAEYDAVIILKLLQNSSACEIKSLRCGKTNKTHKRMGAYCSFLASVFFFKLRCEKLSSSLCRLPEEYR